MDHKRSPMHPPRGPLCRRYGVAVFSDVVAPLAGLLDGDQRKPINWGLGALLNGDVDALGAWLHPREGQTVMPSVLREIHARGAEFIRVGVGDMQGAEWLFGSLFRNSEVVPSVARSLEAVVSLVPPRHRPAMLAGLRACAEAQDLVSARQELARFQCTDVGERYPEIVQRWEQDLARFESIFALHPQLRGLVRAVDWAAAGVRERLARAIDRHGAFSGPDAALEFVAATLMRAERGLERESASAAREMRPSAPQRSPGAGLPALA